MNRISTPLEIKFSTAEAGTIAGYASVWLGEPDSYGDLVNPGAFSASLAEHRRRGTAPPMLWAHDQAQPIGTWTSLVEDATGLRVTGKLALESNAGREAYALLQAKAVTGLSIGYVERAATNLPGGVRRLEVIDLHEISVVALPAASGARITAVKSTAEITPKWLCQVLRDAGLSRGMAEGIIRHGWRGAMDEASEDEAQQMKNILDVIKNATLRICR